MIPAIRNKAGLALIEQLNHLARDPKDGFWLAGLAREAGPALAATGQLEGLTHWARVAVEHYAKKERQQ